MKRFSVCILVAAVAGCAGHPQQPAATAGQRVAAAPIAVATAAPAAAAATKGPVTKQVPVDASNVAEVQRAGYKVVNKDGEKLYCRTDPQTGSRVRTVTQCLTEQELYDQIHQTQNAMSLATQQQSQTFRGN